MSQIEILEQEIFKARVKLEKFEVKGSAIQSKLIQEVTDKSLKIWGGDLEVITYGYSVEVKKNYKDRGWKQRIFKFTYNRELNITSNDSFYHEESYSDRLEQFNDAAIVVKDYERFLAGKRSRIISPIYSRLKEMREMSNAYNELKAVIDNNIVAISKLRAEGMVYAGADFSSVGSKYYAPIGGETNSQELRQVKIRRVTDKSVICTTEFDEYRYNKTQFVAQLSKLILNNVITEAEVKQLMLKKYINTI